MTDLTREARERARIKRVATKSESDHEARVELHVDETLLEALADEVERLAAELYEHHTGEEVYRVREFVAMQQNAKMMEAKITELEADKRRWKTAAVQGRDDLQAIEDAFRSGDPPIGPGQVWAEWCSPANTIRWVDKMRAEEDAAMKEDGE